MNEKQNEEQRKKKISEALKRYYQSDKGIVQRNDLALRQSLKMSKYGEYLKAISNNNETKLNDNEESKL